jgi:thiol-disulfide isomerase/thioredoxin
MGKKEDKKNGRYEEGIFTLYEEAKSKIKYEESKQEKFLRFLNEINREREKLTGKQDFKSKALKSLLVILFIAIGIAIMFLPEKEIVGKSIFDFEPPQNLYIDMGKYTIINFFASWCDPCLDEIPELKKFSEKSTNTTVIGVALDDEKNVKKLVEDMKINYQVVLDNGKFSKNLGINSIPTTLIVGPDLKIKKILFGEVSSERLEKALLQISEREKLAEKSKIKDN